jgi:hypothetical protein
MKYTIGFLVIFLVGCQSEIDKCLDVEMAAWLAKQERISNKNIEITNERNRLLSLKADDTKDKVDYFPNLLANQINALQEIEKDDRTKEEVIADLRSGCMRMANKK